MKPCIVQPVLLCSPSKPQRQVSRWGHCHLGCIRPSWFGGCPSCRPLPMDAWCSWRQSHPQLRIAALEDSDISFKVYQIDSLIFEMLKQGFQRPWKWPPGFHRSWIAVQVADPPLQPHRGARGWVWAVPCVPRQPPRSSRTSGSRWEQGVTEPWERFSAGHVGLLIQMPFYVCAFSLCC